MYKLRSFFNFTYCVQKLIMTHKCTGTQRLADAKPDLPCSSQHASLRLNYLQSSVSVLHIGPMLGVISPCQIVMRDTSPQGIFCSLICFQPPKCHSIWAIFTCIKNCQLISKHSNQNIKHKECFLDFCSSLPLFLSLVS